MDYLFERFKQQPQLLDELAKQRLSQFDQYESISNLSTSRSANVSANVLKKLAAIKKSIRQLQQELGSSQILERQIDQKSQRQNQIFTRGQRDINVFRHQQLGLASQVAPIKFTLARSFSFQKDGPSIQSTSSGNDGEKKVARNSKMDA